MRRPTARQIITTIALGIGSFSYAQGISEGLHAVGFALEAVNEDLQDPSTDITPEILLLDNEAANSNLKLCLWLGGAALLCGTVVGERVIFVRKLGTTAASSTEVMGKSPLLSIIPSIEYEVPETPNREGWQNTELLDPYFMPSEVSNDFIDAA